MPMEVLVCVKRVPDTGARFELTEDRKEIDTRHLEFAVSPHEECAVEEAIRVIERHGGSSTVLTLGPEAATEQLREALAKGIDGGVLLETDGAEWDPGSASRAIAEAIRSRDGGFDLLIFGNEAADTGDYQVGVRVARALGLPYATGIKSLDIEDGVAVAQREASGGWEAYRVPLPAVVTIKEGINVPRHPSLRGIMAAKKKEIERVRMESPTLRQRKITLEKPEERTGEVEILGEGPEAAPQAVEILKAAGAL